MAVRAVLAAVLAVGLLGCGGGERDDADVDPLKVARLWVEAVNERDYGRACKLSVVVASSELSCEALLEEAFSRVQAELPEGAYFDRSTRMPGGGFFSAPRKGGGAPLKFTVEKQRGRFLVHFEVSVIR